MFPALLRYTVTFLQIILFVSILFSFLPNLPENTVINGIRQLAEGINTPAKRLFKAAGIDRGPLDWSPLFTIFMLNILEALIMKFIYG